MVEGHGYFLKTIYCKNIIQLLFFIYVISKLIFLKEYHYT